MNVYNIFIITKDTNNYINLSLKEKFVNSSLRTRSSRKFAPNCKDEEYTITTISKKGELHVFYFLETIEYIL